MDCIVHGVAKSRTRLSDFHFHIVNNDFPVAQVVKNLNKYKRLIKSSIDDRASGICLKMVKNLPANAGDARDMGSIPGSGRSPRGGNGNPLQYSCLENPMDRGARWATVRRATKSQTLPDD